LKKIGIIGLGKMGILHAGIVNQLPNARIQAVCERERLVAGIAKKLLPKGVSFYGDGVEMVSKENLDAVFIATPIASHAPLIIDLADLKPEISLFVEKPLASSAESAKRACEAATKLRGVHMVGFQKRYAPLFREAKRMIDEKSIGDLMFFRAYSYSSDVMREGTSWRFRSETGGVLLDLAPHLLDLLLWLFGEVKSVSAIKRSIYSKSVEDYIHALLTFESGLSGHMDTCWSVRAFRLPQISIEIYGNDGNIVLTDDELRIESDREESKAQVYYNQSFNTSVPFLLANPEYTAEDQAFVDAIDNRTHPAPDFNEAAKVNLLVDQIQAASEE
jgi:predicted dehydrogenase